MPLACVIVVRRAVCPACRAVHGQFWWERSYWRLLSLASSIGDGGPVFEASLRCRACKRRTKSSES